MWVQTVIYVILKVKLEDFILDENRSFWDMMEPHISSIQRCQCGSSICNINGNMVYNVGTTLLEYYLTFGSMM